MNGPNLQLYKFRNSVILSQSHIGDCDYTTNGPFTRNVREFVMDATLVQQSLSRAVDLRVYSQLKFKKLKQQCPWFAPWILAKCFFKKSLSKLLRFNDRIHAA